MKKTRNIVLAAGLVVGLGLVAATLFAGGGDRAEPAQPIPMSADECCFTNPRFTGICKVVPGEDETCSSILAYLNNPNSVGRTYCGNTKIRGGWQQVSCE